MNLYTIALFFHVSGAIGYFVGIGTWLFILVLMFPSGAALIEPRRRAIARLAQEEPDGPLPQALERRTHDPILLTALQTVAALLLGIVFLMTNKPALIGSLIVMAVALVLGLISGVLVSRATRTREQGVSTQVDPMRKQAG